MSAILILLLGLIALTDPTGDPHVMEEVPIESDGDGLTVTLDADGTPILTALKLNFTGLKIDPRAVKLEAIRESIIRIPGANGEEIETYEMRRPKLLRLGATALNGDSICVATRLDDQRSHYSRPIEAVVGLSEFREFIIEFDWDEQKMRLRDNVPEGLVHYARISRVSDHPIFAVDASFEVEQSENPAADTVEQRTEIDRARMEFELAPDSHDFRFIFDVSPGVFPDINLCAQDATRLRKIGQLKEWNAQARQVTVPNLEARFQLLSHLMFGNYRDNQLVVSPISDTIESRLNIRWMLRHHLAFDQRNRRLYLGKRRLSAPQIIDPELSGLTLKREVGVDGGYVLTIIGVKPRSAGESVGLQINDVIVGFNGKEAGQFRLFEVFLAQGLPNGQHSLRIRRGTQEFDAVIAVPALQ